MSRSLPARRITFGRWVFDLESLADHLRKYRPVFVRASAVGFVIVLALGVGGLVIVRSLQSSTGDDIFRLVHIGDSEARLKELIALHKVKYTTEVNGRHTTYCHSVGFGMRFYVVTDGRVMMKGAD